ncbi:M24 family metallopeptidase [Pseudonocardia asaccharolytica]|uniref:X-Pro dipeptidase n=1 Tax=Pseudonocardia asaccharolytica DSM 44247 = NBRC 16224 TaxID=1123024 RepID=A0A511CZA7_9PSEU|nr:Xaa-Pro peptidase family protein [Pseudonocardia asaccharolytica]GEL16604.1 X-Pro dipeptidase [Pseudonocardia asaccharolytica DSM 44247 = NBRC 16224]
MPFPIRRAALRELLRAADLDALLVTDLVNVRYLTGFTGSNAALLVHVDGDAGSRFGTDGRYRLQAGAQAPDLEPIIERACAPALTADAAERRVRRLGFESDAVTVDAHAVLVDAAPGARLERAPGLVQRLRRVKDAEEIAAVRAACAAADAALADLLAAGGLRAGRTEREVALDLENRMRAHGAAGPAFETILAAGANSAVPHHRPTDVPLCRGDLVKIDFGALVDGYHSDMTRMFALGPAAAWQRELYDLVASAQAAGRAALAAGTPVREVDAAAREVIVAAGHGERFPHGLGHGVGLQIHEAPALSVAGTGELAADMVVTVEPGVYLAGRGGVRIEDTLVVRVDGPDPLTRSARALVEV